MATSVVSYGLDSRKLAESTGAWVKRVTIRTAFGELQKQVNHGFDSQPVVITDGRPRRDPNLVKPFGKIEFVARPNYAEVVLWALDQLRRRSPVLTGRYVSSHTVMLNGREITGDLAKALRNTKPGDRIQIVNPQPYARKLEGATASKRTGRKRRRASSRQARSGVYRVVFRALMQRFGRSMFIDFTYVKLDTGVKVWGQQGSRRVLRDQVYPALKLYIRSTGTAVH